MPWRTIRQYLRTVGRKPYVSAHLHTVFHQPQGSAHLHTVFHQPYASAPNWYVTTCCLVVGLTRVISQHRKWITAKSLWYHVTYKSEYWNRHSATHSTCFLHWICVSISQHRKWIIAGSLWHCIEYKWVLKYMFFACFLHFVDIQIIIIFFR